MGELLMTKAAMGEALIEAIHVALYRYLMEVEGAEMFGVNAELTRVTSHRLRLNSHTVELGPVSFEISVNDG
jgi:hypothetical protein